MADYKYVYEIDIDKLKTHPIIEVTPSGGAEIPIKETKTTRLFNANHIRTMVAQYDILHPIIQKHASEITEFVDSNDKPLLTIFPNATIDFHEGQDYLFKLSKTALNDVARTLEEYKQRLEGLNGVLNNCPKK